MVCPRDDTDALSVLHISGVGEGRVNVLGKLEDKCRRDSGAMNSIHAGRPHLLDPGWGHQGPFRL